MESLVETIAQELLAAEQSCQPVAPITERFAGLEASDAYRIQLKVLEKKLDSGRAVIGKKVGLTSLAMQRMLGVNEPDYGHLLDNMLVSNNGTVEVNRLLLPKVEAEIGFVLGADLQGPNVNYLDVLMATEYVVPTLEIIDSRIADWKIKLVDTVADNGSSALVVVGDQRTRLAGLDLRSVGMAMYKNELEVGNGAGAAALGHPAHAVAWLANKLHEFGISLKAGELILPGALSAAVAVQEGDVVTASFGALGAVTVTFR
ncbi:2-keto-4-pentenoate hydratase [Brevibacillus parabrevis]|uniref:2-keto-4-pentenoate hydratase n=1 Tax=Brevibacillus parabrevis TaxID=54914 RepID=UPI00113BD47B|nr:2-keto-4-pentenoate hydratase [Brevibacillus parabrevis]MED1723356.1 2-keto-4-pentenoate hydratase [Brevibacillus parabrevis]TGV05412.1 2-keto-4-pentenoate hydratase [Mesorhizobium sp. M00.F.Ca.ET.186.01.1.1]